MNTITERNSAGGGFTGPAYLAEPYTLAQIISKLETMKDVTDLEWCRSLAVSVLERGIDAMPAQNQSTLGQQTEQLAIVRANNNELCSLVRELTESLRAKSAEADKLRDGLIGAHSFIVQLSCIGREDALSAILSALATGKAKS